MKKLALLVFAVMLLFAFSAWAMHDNDKDSKMTGWISDSKCGAKGAKAEAAECTKKCIEAGAKPVLVTDKDKKVLNIDNPESVKGHEGHHVAVTGDTKGDTIHVESVDMAAEEHAGHQ